MGITTSPIVVHLDTIGMDDYLASDDQAKTVFHALQAYGFLLTHQPPKGVLRRYTFAEFAAVIEMNYDVTEPRHCEVVAVLREVHRLNSGESPVRTKLKSIVFSRSMKTSRTDDPCCSTPCYSDRTPTTFVNGRNVWNSTKLIRKR